MLPGGQSIVLDKISFYLPSPSLHNQCGNKLQKHLISTNNLLVKFLMMILFNSEKVLRRVLLRQMLLRQGLL